MEAIVFETGGDGKQREVCRLRVVDGKIKSDRQSSSAGFVLNRPLYDDEGRKLTREDGEAFLRLMPAAYSGSRLRVGLEE